MRCQFEATFFNQDHIVPSPSFALILLIVETYRKKKVQKKSMQLLFLEVFRAYLVTILKTLSIPKDCFELMYRLGQKTLEFKNVTVEFFAPYLLKDGMVQVKFI